MRRTIKTKKRPRKKKRRTIISKIRTKGKRQAGGVGLLGDIATNAVTFSNSLTASTTGNTAVFNQPAGLPFNKGNAYMV